MKRLIHFFFITVMLLAISSTTAIAQSSVTFILKKFGNTNFHILLNGKEITDMNGTLVKTFNLKNGTYKVYSPCHRTINLNEEGKKMFTVNAEFTNANNGQTTHLEAEILLNLSSQSKHYIHITNKGLYDIQMKELTEKDAMKMLSNKKSVQLPTIDL